jgi:hypothetical protein
LGSSIALLALGAGCLHGERVAAPDGAGAGAALSAAPAAEGARTAVAGLVGMWRFEDGGGLTVADASPLGNDGAFVGDATFTSEGRIDDGSDFGDLDGAVWIPHDASLEPEVGTIEAWIKIAAPQNSDIVMKTTDMLVRTGVPGGGSVLGLRITEEGAAVAFVMNDDPATPGAPWRTAESAAGLVTTGAWHHLAMRWDGSNVAVFVDGVLRDSEPYLPIPGIGLSYSNGSPVGLGVGTAWAIPGPHEFIGLLDEVRYYEEARTNFQIRTDYLLSGDLAE